MHNPYNFSKRQTTCLPSEKAKNLLKNQQVFIWPP